MATQRLGVLSTAGVNDYSLLPIVPLVEGVELTAVASRDEERAGKYARKHGIPRHFGSYEALIADPDIDIVYIPLPNSMHAEWSIRSMRAGKHVLCEKPAASNAAEARAIQRVVRETGRTFAEAFHYRYHPLSQKIEEMLRAGDIGEIKEINASICMPLTDHGKPQFNPDLSGGALMDTGCYPVNFARWIAGGSSAKVVGAESRMLKSGVDGTTRATVEFGNGIVANITCSIETFRPVYANIIGTDGSLFVHMPFMPASRVGPVTIDTYLLLLRRGFEIRSPRVETTTTFQCQLEAFRDAVLRGGQPLTDIDDAVANMRLIDDIFYTAGVPRTVVPWKEEAPAAHKPKTAVKKASPKPKAKPKAKPTTKAKPKAKAAAKPKAAAAEKSTKPVLKKKSSDKKAAGKRSAKKT